MCIKQDDGLEGHFRFIVQDISMGSSTDHTSFSYAEWRLLPLLIMVILGNPWLVSPLLSIFG